MSSLCSHPPCGDTDDTDGDTEPTGWAQELAH